MSNDQNQESRVAERVRQQAANERVRETEARARKSIQEASLKSPGDNPPQAGAMPKGR
jgi:hypothetical protein